MFASGRPCVSAGAILRFDLAGQSCSLARSLPICHGGQGEGQGQYAACLDDARCGQSACMVICHQKAAAHPRPCVAGVGSTGAPGAVAAPAATSQPVRPSPENSCTQPPPPSSQAKLIYRRRPLERRSAVTALRRGRPQHRAAFQDRQARARHHSRCKQTVSLHQQCAPSQDMSSGSCADARLHIPILCRLPADACRGHAEPGPALRSVPASSRRWFPAASTERAARAAPRPAAGPAGVPNATSGGPPRRRRHARPAERGYAAAVCSTGGLPGSASPTAAGLQPHTATYEHCFNDFRIFIHCNCMSSVAGSWLCCICMAVEAGRSLTLSVSCHCGLADAGLRTARLLTEASSERSDPRRLPGTSGDGSRSAGAAVRAARAARRRTLGSSRCAGPEAGVDGAQGSRRADVLVQCAPEGVQVGEAGGCCAVSSGASAILLPTLLLFQ